MAAVTDQSAINALRFLTLGHAQNVRNARKGIKPQLPQRDDDHPETPQLEPLKDGNQKLYSFVPALDGGVHGVEVKQTIHAADAKDDEGKPLPQTLGPKITKKQFIVKTPQFALPEGAVHSVSPAEGERTTAETLPHVVFNDPDMPWERKLDVDDANPLRERAPWMALLVFSQEELTLAEEDLNGGSSIFKGTTLLTNAEAAGVRLQQSSTLTLKAKYNDVELLVKDGAKGIVSPIPKPEEKEDETMTGLVLLKSNLFKRLVTTYGTDGKPKPDQDNADVSRYQYLAHIRHVKTGGMAASAKYDRGLCSIVVSHRLGPLFESKQTPAIAHLVSIQGWENMKFQDLDKAKYVAVSSLHSWTYTAMPTDGFNVDEAFEHLGRSIGSLSTPQGKIDELKKTQPQAVRLALRLADGYTMTRYRTKTGEETAAFFRGAFIPTVPKHPLMESWTAMSDSGTDLQILDQDTGLMDITYSAAWNLGKTLGLADSSFSTSLSRLRNRIHAWSLNASQRELLQEKGAFKTREATMASLASSLKALNDLQNEHRNGSEGAGGPKPGDRWRHEGSDPAASLDLTLTNPDIRDRFERNAKKQSRQLAGSADAASGLNLFNELNTPFSTDWMIVLSWVLDRMYLFGVPAQYLITDQSFLPQETIRFFHIDPNWMDALIDGALSLANHIFTTDDAVRRALKAAINAYIETEDPETGYRPQIPSFGFLLRSDLVKQFPDLKVEAPIPAGAPESQRAPILRHEIISEDVLLVLFDRSPTSDEMPELHFTQPPRQQGFVAGDRITLKTLDLTPKRAYSKKVDKYTFGALPETVFQRSSSEEGQVPSAAVPFLWGPESESRFLLMENWASWTLSELRKGMGADFDDKTTTSALFGFQTGSPIYRLSIFLQQRKLLTTLTADPAVRSLKFINPMRVATSNDISTVAWEPSIEGFAEAPVEARIMTEIPATQSLLVLPAVKAPTVEQDRPRRVVESVAAPMLELADKPVFSYHVFPADATQDDIIPSGTGELVDLVFSIRQEKMAPKRTAYELESITIKIPMGKPTAPSVPATMFEMYNGPGPNMLSNLRFHIIAESGDGIFQIRLVPRSRTGSVPIERVRECSFILGLVKVHDIDRTVKIEVIETYKQPKVVYRPSEPLEVRLKPGSRAK